LSTNTGITHAFATGGTKIVKLAVTNSKGCVSDTFSLTVNVYPNPVASFKLPGNICLPNAVASFTNNTTITDGTASQIAYTWDFGDASTPLSQAAPAPATTPHTYTAVGPFTIKLTATSNQGCVDDTSIVLSTIFAQPHADFSAPAEVCLKDVAAFSDQSTAAASSVTKWYWDLAINNFVQGSKKDTSASWAIAGNKIIRLYIKSLEGCISDTASKTVVVNPLPTAKFTQVAVSCAGKTVSFTDNSLSNVAGSNITRWHFDYGDGQTEDMTNNTSINHTYTTGGTYIAKLVVATDKGCVSDTFTLAVNVYPNPHANFTLPGNICLPNAKATFKNTTTITDGTASQISYVWDFGDGSALQNQAAPAPATITNTFYTVGPFTVKLTATSNQGCIGDTSEVLSTIFAQPHADFTAPTEVCLKDIASFSDQTTAPASTVTKWYWDLATSVFVQGSKKDTSASWTVPGDKIIRLYIKSLEGCNSDTASKTVKIHPLPTASFTQVAVSCAGKSVSFTDNSQSNVTGSNIVKWHFDYGDGQKEDLTNNSSIVHTYTTGGTYIAKLVVTTDKGCVSDTFPYPIKVYPNPVAGFKVAPICLPAVNAVFTDTSKIASGSVVNWAWVFGDGSDTLKAVKNPTHTYAAGGVYNVTLTATSDKGCITTSASVPVTAYNAPTAGDSVVNAAKLCSNLPVTLVNTSVVNGYGTVNKIEIFWDYTGNQALKTTDNAPVAGHEYTNKYPEFGTPLTKNYTVVVRAYSQASCFDDSMQVITLHASPKIKFDAIPAICQEKDTITLTQAYDIYHLLPDTGYYHGDGITGIDQFVPKLAEPGVHMISYSDTTSFGCVSSATNTITVYPTPIIKMDNFRAVLSGTQIKLNPTVTGNIKSYLWTPGTYLSRTDTITPICKPEQDIKYILTVTSKDGCVADSSVFVKVLQDFVVPNTFTPNGDQDNDYWGIKELPLYPIHSVQVFDRYGQIVYHTHRYPPFPYGWDGTYNGKPLPFGTYYYIIELDGVIAPKVGYVTILK
jgi:gliding motility-associated-like protein